ncbi:MAG: glycyl-radical enzyme activating protein [Clostridia bacterium]|nr:glycyl-radical enzyme activating protein [Clostridia bacterium]
MLGKIFDIEEFAVYDGPGIRTVIFFKGCPLRCMWCHNPEGLDFAPTRITKVRLCAHCGACNAVCPTGGKGKCTGCMQCLYACRQGLISIAGLDVRAEDVAERVYKNADLLKMNMGGVTFSGGEPLMQSEFLLEIRRLLRPMHAAIETSGYAEQDVFKRVISELDYVIMDLKVIDPEAHLHYTGVKNDKILKNLEILKNSGVPFQINIPLIPGVNDTLHNMNATAQLIKGAKQLHRVALLPYHKAAGAKYESAGKKYKPSFNENAEVNIIKAPFERENMEVIVL